MPVYLLGCACNRFFRWGMFLVMVSSVTRIRIRLAETRQRIEGGKTLESYVRDERLQNKTQVNGAN